MGWKFKSIDSLDSLSLNVNVIILHSVVASICTLLKYWALFSLPIFVIMQNEGQGKIWGF